MPTPLSKTIYWLNKILDEHDATDRETGLRSLLYSIQSVETSLSHLAKNARKRENRVSPLRPPLPVMPPQRSTLSSISGNRQSNCELTPYTRGKIIGLSLKGAKPTEIQDLLKITHRAL